LTTEVSPIVVVDPNNEIPDYLAAIVTNRAGVLDAMEYLISSVSFPVTIRAHSISVVGAPLAGAQGGHNARPYQPIFNTPILKGMRAILHH